MVDSKEVYDRIIGLYEASGMSPSRLSEKSEVPLTSLNRFLSGETKSPNFYSLCSVIIALGGSVDDILGNSIPKHSEHHHESHYVQQLKEDFHYERKSKQIWIGLFLFLVLAVIVLLIIDILNPSVGFIRYT